MSRTLHELADAVRDAGVSQAAGAAGAPATGAVWPFRGLLLFPANASQLLPLEPAHEWSKEWSTSQAREYYYNRRSGQSIWSEHRKSKPISFRQSAAALLRWDRRDGRLPEAMLLELAAEISFDVVVMDEIFSPELGALRGSAAIAIEPRNSSAAISRVTKRGRPVADAVDKYALRLRTRRPWCRSRRRSGLGSASAAALGSTGSRDFMGSTAMPG